MKFIFKIALFIFIVTSNVCSQNIPKLIVGEWLHRTDYEAPDLIVFRPDNRYSVYNDMDFIGMENSVADIIFDDKSATAITETGNWVYDKVTNQVVLMDRNFIKKNSEFNSYQGKGDKLVFRLEQINDRELTLCLVSKENGCDTYIKNTNFMEKEGKVFYEELIEEYSGMGSQIKEILLSGYETELKLIFDFYKEADQLTVVDGSGRVLFTTGMVGTDERVMEEVSLRGVTKLILKVSSSKLSSKWKFTTEIY